MLLTGFQERMVSKRRQVSIPLNVKSTAEGQTHTSARQPGLKRGRSKRQVISHITAENSLHRQISHLGCYDREKAVCEAIGCFSTRKEVWGWVRATCKGTSWTESWGSGSNWGSIIVSKVCGCHLSSIMKAEMFIQWDHLNVTHFFLVRAGDRGPTEILLREHRQQHTSTPQSEPWDLKPENKTSSAYRTVYRGQLSPGKCLRWSIKKSSWYDHWFCSLKHAPFTPRWPRQWRPPSSRNFKVLNKVHIWNSWKFYEKTFLRKDEKWG